MTRTPLLVLGAVVAIVAVYGVATAQTVVVQAEQLFREGRDAMDAGRYAEACEAFAESQRRDPRPNTLLNLGNCREKNNQLASAWNVFLEAEMALRIASDASALALRDIAQRRARALEPRVSKLTVVVPPGSQRAGLAIARNGEALSPVLWGRPSPVDGGTVIVEATAPGAVAWRTEVVIASEGEVKAVEVPPLQNDPKATEPHDALAGPRDAGEANQRVAFPADALGARAQQTGDAAPHSRARGPLIVIEGAFGAAQIVDRACKDCVVGYGAAVAMFVRLAERSAVSLSGGAVLTFAAERGTSEAAVAHEWRRLNVVAGLRGLVRSRSVDIVVQAGFGGNRDEFRVGAAMGASAFALGSLLVGGGLQVAIARVVRLGAIANWERLTSYGQHTSQLSGLVTIGAGI